MSGRAANDPSIVLCQNVCMLDKHSFTLQQVDLACADFAAIADDIDSLRAQLARRQTRKELAQLLLLSTLTTAALVLVGIEALIR